MVLSDAQLEEYRNRPSKGKDEGFSFPEDLLPACVQPDSSVPLMTMVNCLIELLRFGGSYTLLRKLWGCFRATLGPENPLYSIQWSRSESLVGIFVLVLIQMGVWSSFFCCFSFLFPFFCLNIVGIRRYVLVVDLWSPLPTSVARSRCSD